MPPTRCPNCGAFFSEWTFYTPYSVERLSFPNDQGLANSEYCPVCKFGRAPNEPRQHDSMPERRPTPLTVDDVRSIRIAREEASRWAQWLSLEEPGTTFRSRRCAPDTESLSTYGAEKVWQSELERIRICREESLGREGAREKTPMCGTPNTARLFGVALGRTMGDEVWRLETNGFFDAFDRLPWDLWCDYRWYGPLAEWCLLFIAPPPIDTLVLRVLLELDTFNCLFEVTF